MHRPTHSRQTDTPRRQAGITLITSLIILAVITILGLTMMNTATMGERMSGNWQDRKRAYQAAEMALRDAENYLLATIPGLAGFDAACSEGLCYNGGDGFQDTNDVDGDGNSTEQIPVWQFIANTDNDHEARAALFDNAGKTIDYGDFLALSGPRPSIEGVRAQPRYIIEGIKKDVPGSGVTYYYRITVRAHGMYPGTSVLLQEVFRL